MDRDYYKYFPVSTREWNNSIYVFNLKVLGLIPQATLSSINLIKGYLSIYNLKLERKLRKARLLRRFRKISSHRIYVSNGEFKHTNDKVIITLYTHNRQKYNYICVLKDRYLSLFYSKRIIKKLKQRFYLIKYKGLNYLEKANKQKFTLIKNLTKSKIGWDKSSYINNYLIKFYKKWVKKSLRKIKFYLYYRQLLYINESKYNYTYLQILKNYLQKIYNKKVEFNLIDIKYHYLNSDILSESLTLKIIRNRKKLLRQLKRLKIKIKISKADNYEPKLNPLDFIKDPLEKLLGNKNRPDIESLKTIVLDEIKYKRLSGFRLEASGRISRRAIASRSVRKLIYNGYLSNQDSSYRGLSSVILKGNLKSNLQYSKLKSKTRIGAFSLKGWVSGS